MALTSAIATPMVERRLSVRLFRQTGCCGDRDVIDRVRGELIAVIPAFASKISKLG
jgi:hypothetical protein